MSKSGHLAEALLSPDEPIAGDPSARDDGRSHLITLHLELIKQRNHDGMTLIWERYIGSLLAYVSVQCRKRPRLRGLGAEDLAAETFQSFWMMASSGRMGNVVDREGLLKILCKIARRKVARSVRDENRLKRGGGRVFLQADVEGAGDPSSPALFDQFESIEPLPEDLAIAAETLAAAHAAIPDPGLREVLDLMLEGGWTREEMASVLRRSVTTVDRRLAEIRSRLSALSEELAVADS